MKTAIVFNPSGKANMRVAQDWETAFDLLTRTSSQKALHFFTSWFFDYIQPSFLFGFYDNELEDILDGTGISLSDIKESGELILTRDLLVEFARMPPDVFSKCRSENFNFDLFIRIHEKEIWKALDEHLGPCQMAIGEDLPSYVPGDLRIEKRGDRYIAHTGDIDDRTIERIGEYIGHYDEVIAPVNEDYRRIYDL